MAREQGGAQGQVGLDRIPAFGSKRHDAVLAALALADRDARAGAIRDNVIQVQVTGLRDAQARAVQHFQERLVACALSGLDSVVASRFEQTRSLVLAQKGGQVGPALGSAQARHGTACKQLASHQQPEESLHGRQLAAHGGGIVAAVQTGQIRATNRRGQIPGGQGLRGIPCPQAAGVGEQLIEIAQVGPQGMGRGTFLAAQVLAKKLEQRFHCVGC